jgi:hypothetical protein
MSREDVQRRIAGLAVTPRSVLRSYPGMNPAGFAADGEPVPALRAPESLVLAVAGGPGLYSAVFNSWGGGRGHGVPVTKEIELEFACELPVGAA